MDNVSQHGKMEGMFMVVREEKFLSDASEEAAYWLTYHRWPDGHFGKSGYSLKDLAPASSSLYWKTYLNQEIFDLVPVPRMISIVPNELVSMVGDDWEMKEDRKIQGFDLEYQAMGHRAFEDDQLD